MFQELIPETHLTEAHSNASRRWYNTYAVQCALSKKSLFQERTMRRMNYTKTNEKHTHTHTHSQLCAMCIKMMFFLLFSINLLILFVNVGRRHKNVSEQLLCLDFFVHLFWFSLFLILVHRHILASQ